MVKVCSRLSQVRESLGFLVHNVVIHPLAGLLWFAADLGAPLWVERAADWLHEIS